MFYNLPRFSVDLDFDLLDSKKEDYVFERIKEIISPYGQIKKADKKRFNLFFLLSYQEGSRNIKIEINRRDFGSRYELKTYLGISMKVMVREDMTAHKLTAMYERLEKTNRDIFDVWFFLNNGWPINKEIIEKRTNLSFRKFLRKNISMLGKMSNKGILSGIGELLDEKQKIWAKANLKKDVLFLLKLKMDNEKN
ncbi:nucleotidyl transferase AbiEii/AbiGii toxin family protein, partial [bacterium]|nr:nucleotidyl transferase AbiEii/AbiGii toxin family protein [bacterium]